MAASRAEDGHLYGVIMAGGRGTRFWPASRHGRPKQLLPILGDRPLLRLAVERLLPLVPPERILIVTGADLASAVKSIVPELPKENLLLEPEGRNTAPCIGWAALHLRQRAGDPVMAVLPADHLIRDAVEFRRLLEAAAAWAEKGDRLVTLAIRPAYPETGYGYIDLGACCGHVRSVPVHRVAGFREKPDRVTAESFLRAGTFFWNSGIFVWKTSTILKAIQEHLPGLHQGLQGLQKALSKGRADEAKRLFRQLQAISIDYGVIEKAEAVYAIQAAFGWDDVGSWAAVYDQISKDARGNASRGDLIALQSTGCLVDAPDKLVALVGVQDLIVVDTGDALLVCRRDKSQQVREIVEVLKRERGGQCL
ncbi:MAG: mannose-1-phosphate guanylyltransferase [bacterium]